MSPSQEDALVKIKDIAREHFTSSIIVVLNAGDTNEDDDQIRVTFHGGYSSAIGLAKIGEQELINKQYRPAREDPPCGEQTGS